MLQSHWYLYLRAILELVYFLAGLGIAVAAYLVYLEAAPTS